MKFTLPLVGIFLFVGTVAAFAQKRSLKLSNKSKVEDEHGNILTYQKWQEKLKDPSYGLSIKTTAVDTIFIVYKRSNEKVGILTPTHANPIPKVDENTVVTDVNGNVINYRERSEKLKSLRYKLRYQKSAQTGEGHYMLVQRSEEEIEKGKLLRNEQLLKMPKPKASESFMVGNKFLGHKVTDMLGVKYDLKTITDKVYVINYWFINCPPCMAEIPELNKLVETYKDNDRVVFLAIGLDDDYRIGQLLKTSPFLYKMIADGRFYADKNKVKLYPTHVIVGKDNMIKYSSVSFASNSIVWMKKTIDEAVAELPPKS